MGQKVNPHGIRVGVIKDWDSRWFTSKKEFGDTLVEDYKIRKTLKKQLFGAGIPKIEIERTVDNQSGAPKLKVNIFCAKPGMVIGKGGSEITKLQEQLAKMTGKAVNVNIVEVKNMDTNAQLVAENIASQLERRIGFRRAMKQCMGRAMQRGAKGIKTQVSGRLGGADIARTESYHEGTIPLQTLRADIDYGFAEAATTPKLKVNIFCAKPGMVIGKGGSEITKLQEQLAKMTGKAVNVNIVEVKKMDTNAQLVAENIASQLERRIGFRRAMKQCMGRAMQRGAKGIKTQVSGRLGGADIARTESYHEGTIPLQTLRADIDYGFAEAATTYGRIGVKVWIYKGEVLKGSKPASRKEGGNK